MHVSTYKILVNDDLKIEFKIVSLSTEAYSHVRISNTFGFFFLTFNFVAVG